MSEGKRERSVRRKFPSRMVSSSESKGESFVHNTVNCNTFRFTLRIDKFWRFARVGAFTTRMFQNAASGSGWSLSASIDNSSPYNFMVFHLVRERYRQPSQFVEATVAVVGRFGEIFPSEVKQLHFIGLEKEAYLVSRLEKHMISGWWGLKDLCYLPNDTLTLRCEITEYEEVQRVFESEEAFSKSVQSSAPNIRWRELFAVTIGSLGALYMISYICSSSKRSPEVPLKLKADNYRWSWKTF